MNYIIIIPFSGMFDIERYARENNVKKYMGAYLPCRGPLYPEKFLAIIEEMDNPELNHSTLGGYYFKDLQELLSYRKDADINNIKRGSGCPECNRINNSSKGEKSLKEIFVKNNIKFEWQKIFKDCKDKKSLPFDFYLPEYNCCIEYNGEQHYEPIKYFGGEEGLKDRKKKDQIKKDYCIKNNILFIEIPYTDFDLLSKEYLFERILDG